MFIFYLVLNDLNSHMWLAATTLESIVLEFSIPSCYKCV